MDTSSLFFYLSGTRLEGQQVMESSKQFAVCRENTGGLKTRLCEIRRDWEKEGVWHSLLCFIWVSDWTWPIHTRIYCSSFCLFKSLWYPLPNHAPSFPQTCDRGEVRGPIRTTVFHLVNLSYRDTLTLSVPHAFVHGWRGWTVRQYGPRRQPHQTTAPGLHSYGLV